jgi:hypothetical protein
MTPDPAYPHPSREDPEAIPTDAFITPADFAEALGLTPFVRSGPTAGALRQRRYRERLRRQKAMAGAARGK